jgi:hypothetical protein
VLVLRSHLLPPLNPRTAAMASIKNCKISHVQSLC